MPVNPPYKDCFDLPGVCRTDILFSATLQPTVPSIRLPPTSTNFYLPVILKILDDANGTWVLDNGLLGQKKSPSSRYIDFHSQSISTNHCPCERPEQKITAETPPHVKRLDLGTENSTYDVDQFVRAKLEEVAKVYKWSDWPSEHQVTLLCRNAAGHLGWAATALKWIAGQIDYEGSARRDEIIEEVLQLEMGELYELYAFILDRILPPTDPARKRYLKGLKRVLGCLVVLQKPLNIGSISTLLSLDDFDVVHCMRRISSIIVDGTESLTERTVPRAHKSVVDYLVSSHIQPGLRINLTKQHNSLTTTCFERIQRLNFNVGNITTSRYWQLNKEFSSMYQDIVYPCQWLGRHLQNGGKRATLVSDVENFMKNHFLQWLEVLSLQKLVNSVAVSTLTVLEEQIKVSIRLLTQFGD